MALKRTNFHISEQQRDRLRAARDATGLPIGEIVRRAIDEHLDRLAAERQFEHENRS